MMCDVCCVLFVIIIFFSPWCAVYPTQGQVPRILVFIPCTVHTYFFVSTYSTVRYHERTYSTRTVRLRFLVHMNDFNIFILPVLYCTVQTVLILPYNKI